MKGTSASRNAGVSARELRVRCNPRVPSGIWGFGIRVALSGGRPPQQKMQQEALQNTAWQRTTAMYRGYLWDLNEQPLAPPRNDRPCRRRGRRCLLTPSTARTPPAGTLPPVVPNMRFTNSLLGFLIESARVGPRSRRGMLSTIMEPLKIDPVPLGASQIPAHKLSRHCVASVSMCPCASRRDTRHEHDATHDEHHGPAMPTAHSLRRRANTRGRVRGGIFFSRRRRRCVVGGAFRTFRNYPKYPNQPKITGAFPRLGKK